MYELIFLTFLKQWKRKNIFCTMDFISIPLRLKKKNYASHSVMYYEFFSLHKSLCNSLQKKTENSCSTWQQYVGLICCPLYIFANIHTSLAHRFWLCIFILILKRIQCPDAGYHSQRISTCQFVTSLVRKLLHVVSQQARPLCVLKSGLI